jgi:hypothetical protein
MSNKIINDLEFEQNKWAAFFDGCKIGFYFLIVLLGFFQLGQFVVWLIGVIRWAHGGL